MTETMPYNTGKLLSLRLRILLDSGAFQVVVFAFFSRLLLLAIAWIAFMTSAHKNVESMRFEAGRLEEILKPFAYADVSWYMDIAQNGYEQRAFSVDRHANWAFYPMWPMVLRLNRFLFGEMLISGMFVSTVLFILAAVVLYRLIERSFDSEIASRSVTLLIAFPASYFFLRPGPEALFLLLTIAAFDFAQRGRWSLAGIAGALATLTRLQGILLLLPLGYLYYRQWKQSRKLGWSGAWLLLLPLAQMGFMLHMYQVSGNPLANLLMQRVWDNELALPFSGMVKFIRQPVLISYYGWDLTPFSFAFALIAVILCLKMILEKSIPLEYTVYALASVFLIISRTNLNATLRFFLVIFPLFIVLGRWARRELSYNLIFFSLSGLQLFYFISFVNFFNWAAT